MCTRAIVLPSRPSILSLDQDHLSRGKVFTYAVNLTARWGFGAGASFGLLLAPTSFVKASHPAVSPSEIESRILCFPVAVAAGAVEVAAEDDFGSDFGSAALSLGAGGDSAFGAGLSAGFFALQCFDLDTLR